MATGIQRVVQMCLDVNKASKYRIFALNVKYVGMVVSVCEITTVYQISSRVLAYNSPVDMFYD